MLKNRTKEEEITRINKCIDKCRDEINNALFINNLKATYYIVRWNEHKINNYLKQLKEL